MEKTTSPSSAQVASGSQDHDGKLIHHHENRFIFGATAAVITNLGLITGLYFTPNAKMNIIGSILIIGLADNISDSLGIHIYQESERHRIRDVWLSTLGNFTARLLICLIFIAILEFLPLKTAIFSLLASGLVLLGAISYIVALHRNRNPLPAIVEHLFIAFAVIAVSRYLGHWIQAHFLIH
jgi:VIT1/CCC1 family predicted Fe2+/Mn2+ transporter